MPFSLRLVMHKDFLVIHWRGKSFFNFGRKVILLTIFFGHSATSEVKGQFYKVMDNSAKYMYKTFRKSIITGSWIKTFLSYDLILNDFMDKNFRKVHTFLTIFFGCLVAFGVEGHFFKVVDNPVKYVYKKLCKNILTGSFI